MIEISNFTKSPKNVLLTGPELKKLTHKDLKNIKESKNVVLDANNCGSTRLFIERNIPHIVFNAEIHKEKDYTFQPNSGIDSVIAKLMSEKQIKYGFDTKTIKLQINKDPQKYLPRLKQNFFLCKKFKVDIVLNNKELIRLLENL